MPMEEDWGYIDSDPGRVRAKAYDIMRRNAVLECIQQKAELLPCLFLRKAEHFKHFLLDIILMDSHGTAAKLHCDDGRWAESEFQLKDQCGRYGTDQTVERADDESISRR